MNNSQPTPPLSDDQLSQFHEQGYLVIQDLFETGDLQPVIDEIDDEVNARANQLAAQGLLSSTFKEYGFERQLAKISQETDKVALSIWNGTLAGPAFFHLITHPKLLDVAEQLCGEELIASSVYRLRPKIPDYGYGAVPWHQDSGYFEPYCDRGLVLTVWIPLVDATPERGCLWVLPYQGDILRHRKAEGVAYLEIPDSEMQASEQVCVPVNKGGVLLLTNKTPHASFQNSTDVVRWSMDLRYQSASLPTNAPITRLPEEISNASDEEIPPACYPPEADFLVRSRRRPTEVLRSAQAFHDLRMNHVARPVTNRWDAPWS